MQRALGSLAGKGLVLLTRLGTAVRANWNGTAPVAARRIYFANHRSHADSALIWAVLPPALRARTRPVAAADYWQASAARRFIIHDVFNGVLVERCPVHASKTSAATACDAMEAALAVGDSLILFPEGTRNTTEHDLLPLKSGLYHLAREHQEVELIPTWIDNLNRVMPKGEIVPIPLLCSVSFGHALSRVSNETKESFLARASTALLATRPKDLAQ